MDKRRMIEWLEGFLTSRLDNDAQNDMVEDLDLKCPLEDTAAVFADCEEKLIEMFLAWYNEVAPEEDVLDAFLLTFAISHPEQGGEEAEEFICTEMRKVTARLHEAVGGSGPIEAMNLQKIRLGTKGTQDAQSNH